MDSTASNFEYPYHTFKLDTGILSSPITLSKDYPVQWIKHPYHTFKLVFLDCEHTYYTFWRLSSSVDSTERGFEHPHHTFKPEPWILNKLITLSGEYPMPWIPLNSISSTSDTFLKLETGNMNTSITVSSDSVQWIPLNSVSSTPMSLSC